MDKCSSSFLVILAKVIDSKLAKKWCEKYKVNENCIISFTELNDLDDTELNYTWGKGPNIRNELTELDKRRRYLFYSIKPQEGPLSFTKLGDKYYKINYDIELSYFSQNIRNIYNSNLNRYGMSLVCASYGAGACE